MITIQSSLPTAVALAIAGSMPSQAPRWVSRAVTPPDSGSVRYAVYDSARGETVAWDYSSRETWVFDGAEWQLRASNEGPSGSYAAWCNACYDSHRQRVVMLCGNHSVGLQTWEWDGSDWFLVATGGLLGRHTFAMAFDPVSNRSLVFGGRTGNESGFAELWAWDGVSWSQIANGGPTPRFGAAMAWDSNRQVMLLFGGAGPVNGQTQMFGDTWEWNGLYWLNHFALPGPSPRAYAAMTFDRVRDRMILYGGSNSLHDTWEWDGASWQSVQPFGNPTDVLALTFDSGRGLPVLLTVGTPTQHWEYVAGSATQSTWNTYGVGCAGPAGVPQLDALAGSVPSIGSTLRLAVSALPPSPLNLAFGIVGFDASVWNGQPLPLSLANIGLPGCSAWLAPTYTVTLGNSAGVAAWDIAIPMNVYFVGVEIFTQAAVLVPGWNAANAVLSNAGRASVGTP